MHMHTATYSITTGRTSRRIHCFCAVLASTCTAVCRLYVVDLSPPKKRRWVGGQKMQKTCKFLIFFLTAPN